MKNIRKILAIGIVAMSFAMTGCTEDEIGTSFITHYPVFTLNGDDVLFINQGEEYTDPGVVVTEGDTEIDYTTSVTSEFNGLNAVDTNQPDIYHVTYSAVNQDGFAGTSTRTVIVAKQGNLIDDISGLYTSTVLRNGASGPQYTDMQYVLISKNEDGTYFLSDGIGLYYAVGRGYGNAYLAPATIIANNISTNDFTVPTFTVGTFGGDVDINQITVDPNAKTISFSSVWDAGYTFAVTLTQVQF